MVDETTTLNPLELATELTIAWLGNHNVRASADDVPAFLRMIHNVITDMSETKAFSDDAVSVEGPSNGEQSFAPAVSVRKSLASPDYILSMIDGKPYKMLKRHLARHGLTPAQYRERYKLKADYPITAPAYSEARRATAHQIGLAAKAKAARAVKEAEPAAVEVVAEPAPAKKIRRRKAAPGA